MTDAPPFTPAQEARIRAIVGEVVRRFDRLKQTQAELANARAGVEVAESHVATARLLYREATGDPAWRDMVLDKGAGFAPFTREQEARILDLIAAAAASSAKVGL